MHYICLFNCSFLYDVRRIFLKPQELAYQALCQAGDYLFLMFLYDKIHLYKVFPDNKEFEYVSNKVMEVLNIIEPEDDKEELVKEAKN